MDKSFYCKACNYNLKTYKYLKKHITSIKHKKNIIKKKVCFVFMMAVKRISVVVIIILLTNLIKNNYLKIKKEISKNQFSFL